MGDPTPIWILDIHTLSVSVFFVHPGLCCDSLPIQTLLSLLDRHGVFCQ